MKTGSVISAAARQVFVVVDGHNVVSVAGAVSAAALDLLFNAIAFSW